jgi:hypothetical protein
MILEFGLFFREGLENYRSKDKAMGNVDSFIGAGDEKGSFTWSS